MEENKLINSQKKELLNMHFWLKNKVKATQEDDNLEVDKSNKSIKLCFDNADELHIPFAIQNDTIRIAEEDSGVSKLEEHLDDKLNSLHSKPTYNNYLDIYDNLNPDETIISKDINELDILFDTEETFNTIPFNSEMNIKVDSFVQLSGRNKEFNQFLRGTNDSGHLINLEQTYDNLYSQHSGLSSNADYEDLINSMEELRDSGYLSNALIETDVFENEEDQTYFEDMEELRIKEKTHQKNQKNNMEM